MKGSSGFNKNIVYISIVDRFKLCEHKQKDSFAYVFVNKLFVQGTEFFLVNFFQMTKPDKARFNFYSY